MLILNKTTNVTCIAHNFIHSRYSKMSNPFPAQRISNQWLKIVLIISKKTYLNCLESNCTQISYGLG